MLQDEKLAFTRENDELREKLQTENNRQEEVDKHKKLKQKIDSMQDELHKIDTSKELSELICFSQINAFGLFVNCFALLCFKFARSTESSIKQQKWKTNRLLKRCGTCQTALMESLT